jgi:hypothetical protein
VQRAGWRDITMLMGTGRTDPHGLAARQACHRGGPHDVALLFR